ncbi:MAG: phage integrase SAM-like domain-containing protein [Bacteroidia bacterium]
MASATFVLKEPKSKDNTLVYLLFRYQGQKLKYSTGEKILPKFWNPENQRARETKLFMQYVEFNTLLQKIEDKVFDCYRKLRSDSLVPTPDRLRAELNKKLLVGELEKQNDLINYIKEAIKISTKQPNTIATYKGTLNRLIAFKAKYSRQLTFENIDLQFYEDFMKFCIDKKYAPNSVGTYIKNIKYFMGEAVDKKLTTNTDFKSRRFKKIGEDVDTIYLKEAELNQIYNKDFSKNKTLDRVRDLFIIGCYTGLRYSDLFAINNEHLIDKGTKLRIKTKKTGELVIIPLHNQVRAIIKKHGGIPQYKFTNEDMNTNLKVIAEQADIKETVLISATKGNVVETTPYKKHELVSVHTARRSFATNAFLNKIQPISIMKITGHKTEKSFLRYIKITQQDNANVLQDHAFFK